MFGRFGAPLLLFFLFQTEANALSIDIGQLFKRQEFQARVDITEISPDGDRCTLDVIVTAPKLWSDLDAKIKSRGNLNSKRNRLYWLGPTRLRDVDGANTIYLTSRARYESWTYEKWTGLKFRNFRVSKTVDFYLRPVWDSVENSLSLTYEIENVRNFPGKIEKQLKKLGVDFGGIETFSMPKDQKVQNFDPKIEAPLSFSESNEGNGLSVATKVSLQLPPLELYFGVKLDTCATMKGFIEKDPEKASALVARLIEQI